MGDSNSSLFDGLVFSTSMFDRNGSSGVRVSPLRSFNAQMAVVGEMASDGLDVDVVGQEKLTSEGSLRIAMLASILLLSLNSEHSVVQVDLQLFGSEVADVHMHGEVLVVVSDLSDICSGIQICQISHSPIGGHLMRHRTVKAVHFSHKVLEWRYETAAEWSERHRFLSNLGFRLA